MPMYPQRSGRRQESRKGLRVHEVSSQESVKKLRVGEVSRQEGRKNLHRYEVNGRQSAGQRQRELPGPGACKRGRQRAELRGCSPAGNSPHGRTAKRHMSEKGGK